MRAIWLARAAVVGLCGGVGLAGGRPSAAQDPAPGRGRADIDAMVDKGLDWLKRNQRPDGHWEAPGGQYPTSMTGMAGMALLMEGSTLREGKYSDNLVRAVDWFLKPGRVQERTGQIGNPNNPSESSRYMYGHGFGLLFLASVYGEEEDKDRRARLEAVLTNAVEFCGKAQTSKGGWGYVSAADGGDFDEGSTTITQLQALRAARNAGIAVPKGTIDKAVQYLRECTTPRGGIIYSLARGAVAAAGQERPALTAAAVACAFSAGQYDDEYAKRWIKYCKETIVPAGRAAGVGFDEYQSYYLAQAVYVLGDDRYGRMFSNEPRANWLTWAAYRDGMIGHLQRTQMSDGSWAGGYIGPVFSTAVNLTILQLDKGVLPIYHR